MNINLVISRIKSVPIIVLLLPIFALGIFFRFIGLGNKIYSHDEAYTSLRAAGYTGSEAINGIWDGGVKTKEDIVFFLQPHDEKDVLDTISALAKSEPQLSPLYFILSHYWMRLIGFTPASMRGLSALLSLFVIPGMYWLSMEVFKAKRTALIATLLVSLSPYTILLAQDARPYSLWGSITVISSAALMAAMRKNNKYIWVIYSLFLILGLYSHILFVLVIIAHGIYLAVIKASKREGKLFDYLAASAFALLTFSPWLFQIISRWDFVMNRIDVLDSRISWLHIQRWIMFFTSPIIDLYFNPGSLIPYLLRIPVLFLLGYAIYFLVISTPKSVWALFLLLIGVTAIPLLLSDLFRGGILSLQGRYFVSTNLAIIPIVAHLVNEKLSLLESKLTLLWHLVAALIIVAQLGSVINIQSSETWWTKRLTWNDPQVGHVLNNDSNPLLIVKGLSPTDLGDILALSFSVDEDVRFMLFNATDVEELPPNFSHVYWLHQTYGDFINSDNGKQYSATEVVPYLLWRMDH